MSQVGTMVKMWVLSCHACFSEHHIDGRVVKSLATRIANEDGWFLDKFGRWECPACREVPE